VVKIPANFKEFAGQWATVATDIHILCQTSKDHEERIRRVEARMNMVWGAGIAGGVAIGVIVSLAAGVIF